MLYAWIENGILCTTEFKEYAHPDAIEFSDLTWNDINKLYIDPETNEIKLKSEEMLKQELIATLTKQLNKQLPIFLDNIAKENDYLNYLDVEITANNKSEFNIYKNEAEILNDQFYLMWKKIDEFIENLPNLSYEELKNLDVDKILSETWNSIITSSQGE